MNFLELCKRLRQEASVSGVGPQAVTDQSGEMQRLVNWVQAAYAEILGRRSDWSFLWREFSAAVTAADPSADLIDLPSDFGQLAQDSRGNLAVRFDGADLVPVDFRDYNSADYQGSGTPFDFVVLPYDPVAQARRLRLAPYPAADGTLALSYYANSSHALSGNTDQPWVPPEHRMTIVWRALMMYANYESATELLQQASTNFGEAMAQMEADCLPDAQRFRRASNHDVVEVV